MNPKSRMIATILGNDLEERDLVSVSFTQFASLS
jgi:hypothetical protein